MKHYAEASILRSRQLSQLLDYDCLDIGWQSLRLRPPAVVPHVVHITIAAIEVASSGDLQEDRVDRRHDLSRTLAIVPIIGAIVVATHRHRLNPHFLD
jgi:hypothetical protein